VSSKPESRIIEKQCEDPGVTPGLFYFVERINSVGRPAVLERERRKTREIKRKKGKENFGLGKRNAQRMERKERKEREIDLRSWKGNAENPRKSKERRGKETCGLGKGTQKNQGNQKKEGKGELRSWKKECGKDGKEGKKGKGKRPSVLERERRKTREIKRKKGKGDLRSWKKEPGKDGKEGKKERKRKETFGLENSGPIIMRAGSIQRQVCFDIANDLKSLL
jgi:hypothetical protein